MTSDINIQVAAPHRSASSAAKAQEAVASCQITKPESKPATGGCARTKDVHANMHRPLFREEALQAQHRSLDGEVVLVRPVPFSVLSIGAAFLSFFLLAFLFFGTYTRTETVTGVLKPVAGLTTVFSIRRGIVNEIKVHSGDHVEKGQLLMIVGHSRSSGNAENIDEEIATQMHASIALLEEQRRQLKSMKEIDLQRIRAQIANLQQDIATIDEQVNIQEERAALLKEDAEGVKSLLADYLIAESEHRRKYEQYLQVQLELKRLERERVAKIAERKSSELELKRIPGDYHFRVAELARSITQLRQQLIEVDADRSTAVRAPVTGRIATVLAEEGNEADPRRPVLKILPEGSLLEAELYVPSASPSGPESRGPSSRRIRRSGLSTALFRISALVLMGATLRISRIRAFPLASLPRNSTSDNRSIVFAWRHRNSALAPTQVPKPIRFSQACWLTQNSLVASYA